MATSAASRVLCIPELLSTMLNFCTDSSTLASCMCVNSLWASKAVEILWETCGSDRSLGNLKTPLIYDLAALALRPERLSWYSRRIKALVFNVVYAIEPETTYQIVPEDDSSDDARFHRTFLDTEFPRLERVEIYSTKWGRIHNKASSLLQYLQPNLKVFTLSGGALSDAFFSVAKISCPGLVVLSLNPDKLDDDHNVSVRVFSEFLTAMKSLRTLDIRNCSKGVLSVEIVRLLANHRSLKYLQMPAVSNKWIGEIVSVSGDRLFPNVEMLNIGISDIGLELLVPHIQHITELKLKLFGPSTDALRIAASMPGLTSLCLDFPLGSVIQARDLAFLAERCSNLVKLHIPSVESYTDRTYPVGEGMFDATIDYIARRLPKLEELLLKVQNTTLTEVALASLAIHCSHLRTIHISADVTIENLVRNGRPNLFPSLDILRILLPESNGTNRPSYKDMKGLARNFATMAPNLYTFEFRNADPLVDNGDFEFENVVCGMLPMNP